MSNEIIEKSQDIITSLVLNGDIGKMSPDQKVTYYNKFCDSLGLNPMTQPFQIIAFQGKQRLYATKDATEQLRKINGVSVIDQRDKILNDMYIVDVQLQDAKGRIDTGKGVVNIKGMSGDNLANAMMKAETKAKRRGTLSICGLGILDETELETIPEIKNITPEETEEKKLKRRQAEAKEKYNSFYNSLSDDYKFELKDLSERERFLLFQDCKWDIANLDVKIIKMNEQKEKKEFDNPFSDADIPF
jgi:hypothetical protein